MKITENEVRAMKLCLNYDNRGDQRSDNFSNAGPTEIAEALGWNMHQIGGLLTSLEQKDLVKGVADSPDVEMHIAVLTAKGIDLIFDTIEGESK